MPQKNLVVFLFILHSIFQAVVKHHILLAFLTSYYGHTRRKGSCTIATCTSHLLPTHDQHVWYCFACKWLINSYIFTLNADGLKPKLFGSLYFTVFICSCWLSVMNSEIGVGQWWMRHCVYVSVYLSNHVQGTNQTTLCPVSIAIFIQYLFKHEHTLTQPPLPYSHSRYQ